jgi:hypothetical protein
MDLNLPNPGAGRWWKIELIAGQTGKPMKLSLMESFSGAVKKPATAIYYLRTFADAKSIEEAAQKVLDAVGNYQSFVGEYLPPGPALSGWSTITIDGQNRSHYFRSGESLSLCGKAIDNGTRSEAGPNKSNIDCPKCTSLKEEAAAA